MNIRKNMNVGLRRCAAIAAGAVICASLFIPARISAQNPGLGGAKTAPAIPIPLEDVVSRKPTEYIVGTGEITRDLLLTGELKAARSSVIQAPRSQQNFGNTITFLADEGAIVKTGELVVEFDDTSLINNKTDAETTLETAILNVTRKKVDLESNRCDLLNSLRREENSLRRAELYAKIDKSLLSENQYERYRLDIMKAQLQLEKARENLDNFEKNYDSEMTKVEITKSQAELQLRRIESDIAQTKIYARQEGIFLYGDNWQSNRKVQTGDSIFPGMEVASIPDMTSLQVVGYVFDTEYRQLSRGMRCEVSFDALPGVNIGGTVVSLTDVAGRRGFASTQKMFQATVQLDSVDTELFKPGMTARVNVPLVLANAAAAAPREYVGVDSQGRNFVRTGADIKKADTQFVKLGAIGDKMIEIASGVSVGEKLFPVQ